MAFAYHSTEKCGREPLPPMPNGAWPPLTLMCGSFGLGILRCNPEKNPETFSVTVFAADDTLSNAPVDIDFIFGAVPSKNPLIAVHAFPAAVLALSHAVVAIFLTTGAAP